MQDRVGGTGGGEGGGEGFDYLKMILQQEIPSLQNTLQEQKYKRGYAADRLYQGLQIEMTL